MPPSRAIPDRWTQYKPVGSKIQGTRFIAFKVPLRSNISESVEEQTQLDCDMLLKAIPDLGLIIDLTNTNRYYDPEYFKSNGVEHRKLMIPGHVTPPEHLVQLFKRYVKDYLSDNKHNNKLIGVHCTHGVNRSGFLICNYMISEMTINPDDAIKVFSDARGHSIERQNYLVALKAAGSRISNGNDTRIEETPIHSDKSDNLLQPKRRSRSRENLMNFEQRWNAKSKNNRPRDRPQYRNADPHARSRGPSKNIDNGMRRSSNRMTMHDERRIINYNDRRNSSPPKFHDRRNTERLRDRQPVDQRSRNTEHWRHRQSVDQRSRNIDNWRDRRFEDQRIKRDSFVPRIDYDRSKYNWSRNSICSTNDQSSRSHDTHG